MSDQIDILLKENKRLRAVERYFIKAVLDLPDLDDSDSSWWTRSQCNKIIEGYEELCNQASQT